MRCSLARYASQVATIVGADEEKRHGRGHGQPDLVAAHELRRPIRDRVLARDDRQSFQVSPDILGELSDGRIATFRLQPQRL